MKPKEWQESYGIIYQDNYEYFGQLKKSDNSTYFPYGTGLYFNANDKSFTMVEHAENNKFEGMFFARRNSDTKTIINFEAGLYKNDKMCGPQLSISKDNTTSIAPKLYDIINYNINQNGVDDGPFIYLTSKNEYYIYHCENGKYQNKRVCFCFGKLLLEKQKENSDEYETLAVIDCGWNYELKYYQIAPDYCFSFNNYGVRPAFSTKEVTNKTKYHYHGALLTYTKEQEYIYDNDDNRKFINEPTKYGIIDYENNNKYFGEIISINKDGDYERSGFGCFRNIKDNTCYLGGYSSSKRHGVGLLIDGNLSHFGNFKDGKRNGVILTRTDSTIIISKYKDDKRVGNYYVVNNNTFDVEIRDENCLIIDTIKFDESKKVEINLSKEEKISPMYKEILDSSGLLYEVDEYLNIYIIGVKNKNQPNYVIPDFVLGIRKFAFSNLNALKDVIIEDGVKFIEEGAFKDSNNIASLRLAQTIDVIEKDTFTSLKLKEVKIPRTVKLIKNYAFSACKGLERVFFEDYSSTVVEEFAFPKKFKDINGMNTKEDLERKEEEQKEREEKNQKIKDKIKKKKEAKEKFDAKIKKLKEKLGIFKKKTKDKVRDLKDDASYFYKYKFKYFFKNLFSKIYDFFDDLFYNIKEFFTYEIPRFFSKIFKKKRKSYRSSYYRESLWDKIKNFFRWLLEGIISIITAPFKMIADGFRSEGAIIVGGVVLSAVLFILAFTGLIEYVAWDVTALWPKDKPFFNYCFELMNLAMDGFVNLDQVDKLNLINGFFLCIFFVVGLLIDLVLYILMLVFLCIIPLAVQIIIQLALVFVLPPAIPIVLFIIIIKNDSSAFGKSFNILMLIASIVLTVLYFIFMTRLL